MESNWAAEHLQVIRTLMERSAVYRRALAPMMLLAGGLGLIAAVVGCLARIDSPVTFISYWLGVGVAAVIGALLLVRREALKASEPFWSPPARRVAQAVLPPLTAGLIGTIIFMLAVGSGDDEFTSVMAMLWLPIAWLVLYGCAVHAAGFFMPRGIKLFGWAFIVGGCGVFALGVPDLPRSLYAHGVMGAFFGVLHLAYGLYLYFTEQRKNEA